MTLHEVTQPIRYIEVRCHGSWPETTPPPTKSIGRILLFPDLVVDEPVPADEEQPVDEPDLVTFLQGERDYLTRTFGQRDPATRQASEQLLHAAIRERLRIIQAWAISVQFRLPAGSARAHQAHIDRLTALIDDVRVELDPDAKSTNWKGSPA